MMIPVYLKHLIIAVPLTLNGIVSGVLAYAIGIKGTLYLPDLVIQAW